jgi:hypothetical protein
MTGDTMEAGEPVMITGLGFQELIDPVETDCPEHDSNNHEWVTPKSAETYGFDPEQLEGSEDEAPTAFCFHCGVETTITETEKDKNVVVAAGREKIAQYIVDDTAVSADFRTMRIGSAATPAAPATGDTTLSNTVDSATGITPTRATTGGVSNVAVWSTTFASGGTSKTSVNEQGMFDGTGTAAAMLNRLTFTAKDNANNDLKLTYKLTVGN